MAVPHVNILSENVGRYKIVSGFFIFRLQSRQNRGKLRHHGGIWMEKASALYQLMNVRMNGITNSDGEYQAIPRRSDEYPNKLKRIGLPLPSSPASCHHIRFSCRIPFLSIYKGTHHALFLADIRLFAAESQKLPCFHLHCIFRIARMTFRFHLPHQYFPHILRRKVNIPRRGHEMESLPAGA